ncbi:methyl-accepting chemotaxis protein [Rummeliibacillus sp. G93]|uniref:methyl-accepting chemotaxis protein n=1 Tax=Rummeliibacillus TaxID=648802 RepID=UPI0017BC16C2|nr:MULTISPECIES: methyl-accepting chemotaxis protein [Rummeliibacillus]MBB5170817.1 methyl-accepting chemotaxis protein [Rummeliibacillus stabekisii]UQW96881.1 methyl-accepting chemotaxis protein [Rummeliibacillus sp. G93]
MNRLFQLNSIRKKIVFGFSIVIALVVILGVFNILAIQALNKNTNDMVKKEIPLLKLDEQMALNMSERTSLIRGYILYGDSSLKDEFKSQIDESIALENKLLKLSNSTQVKSLIDKKVTWGEQINRVIEEYDNGNKEEAKRIMATEVKPLEKEIMDGFKQLSKDREEKIAKDGEEFASYGTSSLIFILILTAVAAIAAVLIEIKTVRVISRPIIGLVARVKEMAKGDLSQEKIEPTSNDEIGELILATNEMNENTRLVLEKINSLSNVVASRSEELTQSSMEVRTGTEQIATTMQELASGAETQADSASNLAMIMGSFVEKVEETNENGSLIQQNSEKVLSLTEQGTSLMTSTTEQMAKIDQLVKDAVMKVQSLDHRSQEITTLISVIKDVADQTNLLALNAAIEAARAGEHGKGFAVVAEEVRKLAEQVALSVNDITGIITAIQSESGSAVSSLQAGYTEVEQGTIQIENTGMTFNEINGAVTEMGQNIRTVSGNLSEIKRHTLSMNASIDEVASVAEEAAAGVEQTAASAQQASSSMEEVADSSKHLATLVDELNELVSRFKI